MGQGKASFGRMGGFLVGAFAAGLLAASSALAADPLKIGFSKLSPVRSPAAGSPRCSQ